MTRRTPAERRAFWRGYWFGVIWISACFTVIRLIAPLG